MNGVDRSVGPVEGIDGILVVGRKIGTQSGHDTGGATRTDIGGWRQRVWIPGGPLAGARTPAKLASAGAVVDAGGAIPGGAAIPLHVGVVGEHFPVGVEGHIVLVAESRGVEVPALAVGVSPGNPAAGGPDVAGVTPGIGHPGQEEVLGVVLGDGVDFRLGRLGVIAAQDHEGFAVRREDYRMWTVFSATLEPAQGGDLVELIIPIGVGEVVESTPVPAYAASIHADVEAVEGPQQAVAATDRSRHLLDFQLLAGGDPPDPGLALVTAVEAALVVDRHGYPGTLLALGNGVDLFHLETFGMGDRFALGGWFFLGRLLGDAGENDVLGFHLHRPAAVKLQGEHA